MDLIVNLDRSHQISRSVHILHCEKGKIPISPFTVTGPFQFIVSFIALKRSLLCNNNFADIVIKNGFFRAIPRTNKFFNEANTYVRKKYCFHSSVNGIILLNLCLTGIV